MTRTPLNLNAANSRLKNPSHNNWRILIVDDEAEVHNVTKMILGKMRYKERGIEILSAYSAAEAQQLLAQEKNIAVVLLDVVMETDDAGLQLVKIIREQQQNLAIRIILRTGQPGQAPEEKVIVDYDINDYKAKSELTAQKLFTTVVASLRSYETIVALEKNKQGLKKILESTSTLFQIHSLQTFASGVLTQLSTFLDCQPNGIIYLQCDPNLPNSIPLEKSDSDDLLILACTGVFETFGQVQKPISELHQKAIAMARQTFLERTNIYTEEFTSIFLNTGNTTGTVVIMYGGLGKADELDIKLLEVFSEKIAIAFANAIHYQKMISAERAATIDFLTGLDNRRQLLRLAVPLVEQAYLNQTSLAVAMVDIDFFKEINDQWGHDAGDQVLKQISRLMKAHFINNEVLSRFGGEEFCILVPNQSKEQILDLFESLRQKLVKQNFVFDGQQIQITISIGISLKVINDIDAMISNADILLYQAKNGGRNKVVIE